MKSLQSNSVRTSARMAIGRWLSVALLATMQAGGQQPAQLRILSKDLPAFAMGPLAKLGGRLTRPEKARIQLAGTIQDSSGTRPIQVEWQIPGQLRIDEGGGNPNALRFDGATLRGSHGAISAREESLVESLALDLPENLLHEMAGRASVRVVMTGLHKSGTPPSAPLYSVLRLTFPPGRRAVPARRA